MARIVATIFATVAFVAFALSNASRVQVSFVVGEPVETRLIFVLLTSFGLGVFGTIFYRMSQDAMRTAAQRKIRARIKTRAHKEFEHE